MSSSGCVDVCSSNIGEAKPGRIKNSGYGCSSCGSNSNNMMAVMLMAVE